MDRILKKRNLTADEIYLIKHLINKSGYVYIKNLHTILVGEMNDGGMGSLLFSKNGNLDRNSRSFGKEISKCSFYDSDGVCVSVSLNIDKDGDLFELDVRKVDYSQLIKIPKDFD